MSTPETKPGFLSAGITALSPWGSRSATPKPPPPSSHHGDEDKAAGPGAGAQRGGDHVVNRRPRLSLRKYPSDCPPLVVRWFHAVDIPKRRPFSQNQSHDPSKPPPRPKKWIPFSAGDSRSIESAYQKQSDEEEAAERRQKAGNLAPDEDAKDKKTNTQVPVNEDYLFNVDIEERELAPAYWLGPVYEVKRGTWFTPDGEPCDENLATQLEEGYLKTTPWRNSQDKEKRSASQPRTRPISLNVKPDDDYRKLLGQRDSNSNPVTPKSSMDDLRGRSNTDSTDAESAPGTPASPAHESSRAYRLFGAYMNSVVTYQDEKTAFVLTDDFLSRMGSTLYQKFAGGAHYAGAKYIRGFVDPSTKKQAKPAVEEIAKKPEASPLAYGEDPDGRPRTASSEAETEYEAEDAQSPSDARRRTLERHVSSLIISSQAGPERQEEEIRKRDEQEMREDYKDEGKAEQGREIEHLLLVTHGIGQRLGMRMESVNFIHDVNSMRKSLKSVYASSPDLQALNSDLDQDLKNSRVQVLPICWRHLLDFPKQSLKHNRKEHDLGDLDYDDEDYPNLEDITVEGVPAVRNLLTDLALDILLYQSPAYKGHISRIVVQECNRIYKLFKERNPAFKGKVSFVGHSLGSAIMFDLLCQQKTPGAKHPPQSSKQRRNTQESFKLDFEVEDFYALGSPIGLFQMMKGRTIAARPAESFFTPAETPQSPLDDPFSSNAKGDRSRAFDITTSSPVCRQLFNIFHPTDPISYRLEPLISPAMSALKPQPLPYTKKGIFGAPTQGLTGIGTKVSQGVTDFWSSVSSGIASGLLNRSLGLSGTDATKMSSDLTHGQRSHRPLVSRPGASTSNASAQGVDEPIRAFVNEERKRKLGEDVAQRPVGEQAPTLIDSEIETLYSGFQKRRASQQSAEGKAEQDLEWRDLEDKSRRLRKEEQKVRGLNANGRVDYSIQEGAFDISLLASIASHLSYWADEDVAHFMISQLLARNRPKSKVEGGEDIPGASSAER